MSIFGGERTDRVVFDEARLLSATVPCLRFLKSEGCACLADCTTAGIGRRVDLLSQISRESGIVILPNTGYYGAAGRVRISLDGLHPEGDAEVIAQLSMIKAEGLLDHVLLSHDGNPFTADGSRRPFDHPPAGFRLAAVEAGFTPLYEA